MFTRNNLIGILPYNHILCNMYFDGGQIRNGMALTHTHTHIFTSVLVKCITF